MDSHGRAGGRISSWAVHYCHRLWRLPDVVRAFGACLVGEGRIPSTKSMPKNSGVDSRSLKVLMLNLSEGGL